jgi:hypothetical protein
MLFMCACNLVNNTFCEIKIKYKASYVVLHTCWNIGSTVLFGFKMKFKTEFKFLLKIIWKIQFTKEFGKKNNCFSILAFGLSLAAA